MGTRQLQKAQLEPSPAQLLEPSGACASESSSENGDGGANTVAFNPFAFLGADDANVCAVPWSTVNQCGHGQDLQGPAGVPTGSIPHCVQEEEEEDAEADHQEGEGLQSGPPAQSKPVQQKVKRKNKKKRQPGASAPPQCSHEDSTDVDAALQELGITLESEIRQAEQQAAAARAPQEAPLALQPKTLNPDEELRLMFGSAVMALEQSERQQGRQQGRNPPSRPRGWKPTQSRAKLLSRPANMPVADGLLSMQCLGASYPMHTLQPHQRVTGSLQATNTCVSVQARRVGSAHSSS